MACAFSAGITSWANRRMLVRRSSSATGPWILSIMKMPIRSTLMIVLIFGMIGLGRADDHLHVLLTTQQRGVKLAADFRVIDRPVITALHLLPHFLAADAEPRAGLLFGEYADCGLGVVARRHRVLRRGKGVLPAAIDEAFGQLLRFFLGVSRPRSRSCSRSSRGLPGSHAWRPHRRKNPTSRRSAPAGCRGRCRDSDARRTTARFRD